MTSEYLLIAATMLTAVVILAHAGLRGWQGWLQLKTRELEMHRPDPEGGSATGAARIELADLKERIRKLEAIAAGDDAKPFRPPTSLARAESIVQQSSSPPCAAFPTLPKSTSSLRATNAIAC